MRRWKKSLALVTVFALLLTLLLPAAGWAQFKTLPVPPAPGKGYDAAKQADAMVKRHDVAPVLDSKLVEKLKSTGEGELVPVIIHMRDKADLKKLKVRFNKQNFSPAALEQHKKAVIDELKTHAQKTQAPVLTALEEHKAKGKARDIRSFWLFNGITAKVGKEVIYELARNPLVEKIVYDDIKFTPVTAPVEGRDDPAAGVAEAVYGSEKAVEPAAEPAPAAAQLAAPAPQQSVTWGVAKIGADQVWSMGYDGTGVVVGHLDTGVDPRHPDLLINPGGDPNDLSNWKLIGWAEFDYYGNMISSDRQYAYDDDGHGTHTAGTILGGAASGTHIGVAPGARLVSGKVLTGGGGTFAQVAAGMEWIVTVPGVRVVNMSLGATGTWSEMIEPTRNMVEMFVFPSFAIGNSGPGSSGSPGNVPAACGVGATDEYDDVAYFSSGEWVEWDADPYHGKYLKPDVSAPGVNVYSSIPGNGYATWMGTSMAAPHVTGSVALVLQVQPWLSVEEVRSLLRQTAVDLGTAGPDTRYGWGRINVKAAVDLLQTAGFVSGSITGPDAEAVEADIAVDGCVHGKADPVYGTYDLLLPPGSHILRVSHPLYKDASATVNIVTGGFTEQNFSLEKKALGWFAGTVKNASGQPVANAVVELEGVDGAVTRTDSQGRYCTGQIPEGTYKMRVTPPLPYGIQRVDVTIPASGGPVTKDFTVNTADTLLVDHDYWDNWETYYLEALFQKGYSVAYWDWDAALLADWDDNGYRDTNCLPPVDVLKQFGKVILADVDGYVLFADDTAPGTRTLRQYLDTGRKMFVSGQDIGYFSANDYPEFYRNYLHASYLADVGSWLVRGVPADGWPRGIFEGLELNIESAWPDVVAPADDQAVSVADYVDPYVAGSGALAVDGPLHRLMYFSFGFEGINGADTRANVMDRVMKFLDSPTENTRETIKYSSAWSAANDANATDGRYRISSSTGATVTFTFTGDNITWVTAKGPSYGRAEVFIDGTSKGQVDLYNATQVWQHQQSYTGLTAGSHTITIKVLGQKSTASSGFGVVVDAFAVRLDDTDPAASYAGSWFTHSSSGYYKGVAHVSKQVNAACTFTFTGSGVTWFTSKGPNRGIARVYLDGVNKGTVDLYAPSYGVAPAVTFTGLANTRHTLKIVVTGQKNASSTDTYVIVDAFGVYTEDNSASVSYSSAWGIHKDSGYSGGSIHYTTSANARASYVFAGNSITWLTAKGPNRGVARVFIDGVDKGTVDLYAPNWQARVPITYSGLFYGLHTIEIVNTGTKNPSSTGYFVIVDAFKRGLNE
jgi:bacillopeptidase F